MVRKLSITYYVEREREDSCDEIELTITATAQPPEPDVGLLYPSFEDIEIRDKNDNEVVVTKKEENAILEKLSEAYYDRD